MSSIQGRFREMEPDVWKDYDKDSDIVEELAEGEGNHKSVLLDFEAMPDDYDIRHYDRMQDHTPTTGNRYFNCGRKKRAVEAEY